MRGGDMTGLGAKKHIPIVQYPGELGEPHVRIKPAGILTSLLGGNPHETEADRAARAQKENLDALGKKIALLAQHYQVDDGDTINWKRLAIELAFAHVPGFTTVEEKPRKRGRPGAGYFNFALYEAVLNVLDEGEPTVANACRRLSKRSGEWKGKNPDTLETRFHEQRRRADAMDLRPHLRDPATGVPLTSLALELGYVPPKPSAKYPPVPFKLGGLFALGAKSLYDHEKP
jgi:hypothetical protein